MEFECAVDISSNRERYWSIKNHRELGCAGPLWISYGSGHQSVLPQRLYSGMPQARGLDDNRARFLAQGKGGRVRFRRPKIMWLLRPRASSYPVTVPHSRAQWGRASIFSVIISERLLFYIGAPSVCV